MPGPLGTRGYWAYTSDTGKIYTHQARDADESAVGNTQVDAEDHPALPTSRLKVRGVWGTASPGVRRFFTIGEPTNSLYQAGGSINVDGEVFVVTGRRGERDHGAVID